MENLERSNEGQSVNHGAGSKALSSDTYQEYQAMSSRQGLKSKDNIAFYKPTLTKQDIKSVMECMIQDEISTGNIVLNYEKEFANVFGYKHALSTMTATAAYHLALLSLSVGENKNIIKNTSETGVNADTNVKETGKNEVILSSVSTVPMLDAIYQVGAEPVLVDIAAGKYHPLNEEIISKVTEQTKVIILFYANGAFHNYHPLIEQITELNKTRENKIRIIEDLSYNIGVDIEKEYLGVKSDLSVVSLHEDMPMTIGKGAMLLFNSKNTYSIAKDLRMHGNGRPYKVRYDYTIADYQGAMGIEQLGHLSTVLERCKQIGQKYNESMVSNKALQSYFNNRNLDSYGNFPVITDKPLEYTQRYFKSAQIDVRRTMPFGPLHDMLALPAAQFPNTQKLYDRGISIPIYPNLTKNNVERIMYSLKGFY